MTGLDGTFCEIRPSVECVETIDYERTKIFLERIPMSNLPRIRLFSVELLQYGDIDAGTQVLVCTRHNQTGFSFVASRRSGIATGFGIKADHIHISLAREVFSCANVHGFHFSVPAAPQ